MQHSATLNTSCQHLNSRLNSPNHLTQYSSRILLAGALLLVGASAALGSYFGYVIGSQQHMLLGLVFAGAALGGEVVKPYGPLLNLRGEGAKGNQPVGVHVAGQVPSAKACKLWICWRRHLSKPSPGLRSDFSL
jgi:hypothetical protein